MNGLVVYDSYYGNAGQVAEAIAEELREAGHEVQIFNLHQSKPKTKALAPQTAFIVVGGPTRMKHISRRAKGFAKGLKATNWTGKPALIFDTYGPLDPDPAKNEGNKWLYPGGVADLRQVLEERGLVVWPEDLRCLVTDMRGPLAEGALDDARAAARRFAAGLAGGAGTPV
jgi:flavodoxin